ncbi:MAG: photosynthetic complex assembly protein PuhC [Pseudomonadota bacterium]
MAGNAPMRHPTQRMVPHRMMMAIVILLGAILALVAFARLTGMEPTAQPPRGPILSERIIHIDGNIAGAVRVTDQNDQVITDLPAGKGVFISTVNRVLLRERARFRADPDGPLHLRMREGNRLAIYDPATDRETELVAFGTDNVAAFAGLLTANLVVGEGPKSDDSTKGATQ